VTATIVEAFIEAMATAKPSSASNGARVTDVLVTLISLIFYGRHSHQTDGFREALSWSSQTG
jgi:hypothetical protein